MQQHSEFYTFAVGFWWLIFPIGWGLVGVMRVWLRHQRAQKALELLNTYAQQNREPPPEVLAQLRGGGMDRVGRNAAHGFLAGGIILAGIALAFLSLLSLRWDDQFNYRGLVFVAIIIGGASVAMFVRAWLAARDRSTIPPP